MAPAKDSELVQSLLTARDELLIERDQQYIYVGRHMAKIRNIDSDIASIDSILERRGLEIPAETEPAQGIVEAQQPQLIPPVERQASVEPRSAATLDVVVTNLIQERGVSEAARRVCEWALRTKQVPNPSTVRAIFAVFPPSLRTKYNPATAKAIEALRVQIRTWVNKGETVLNYEVGGLVSLPPQFMENGSEAKETA